MYQVTFFGISNLHMGYYTKNQDYIGGKAPLPN